MRKFTPLVRQFFQSGIYSGFLLTEISYINSNLNADIRLAYTTLPFNATLNGVMYSSDHFIVNFDPPKLSDVTDKAAFRILFSDVDGQFTPIADQLIGADIILVGGFYNSTGEPVLSTSTATIYQPNAPILDPEDMFVIYSGKIDTVKFTASEGDGMLFEIQCGSPVANLDAVNSFHTTPTSLAQRIPPSVVDTAFDNISIKSTKQEILWGKI